MAVGVIYIHCLHQTVTKSMVSLLTMDALSLVGGNQMVCPLSLVRNGNSWCTYPWRWLNLGPLVAGILTFAFRLNGMDQGFAR